MNFVDFFIDCYADQPMFFFFFLCDLDGFYVTVTCALSNAGG